MGISENMLMCVCGVETESKKVAYINIHFWCSPSRCHSTIITLSSFACKSIAKISLIQLNSHNLEIFPLVLLYVQFDEITEVIRVLLFPFLLLCAFFSFVYLVFCSFNIFVIACFTTSYNRQSSLWFDAVGFCAWFVHYQNNIEKIAQNMIIQQ